MEILVHNISHTDLVVELSWQRESASEPPPGVPLSVLARPKFSLFQPVGERILARVQALHASSDGAANGTHAAAPVAAADANVSPQEPTQAGLLPSLLDLDADNADGGPRWRAQCRATQRPIGFSLRDAPVPVDDLDGFQLRGERETARLIDAHWTRAAVTAVYFPLAAVLLPKWMQVLEQYESQTSQQVAYLVSGAGIPRNAKHAVNGNSTEATAQLMALFARQYYPRVEVAQVHSGSNIFRLDDNVQFMVRELRPRLEARREAIVAKCGDAWRAHFHVTIAYADGPPARLSALNASLRLYRPSYLHVWQLKTFWHERRLSLADVDFHAFENVEASPCVAVGRTDALTQTLATEMRAFRDQFLAAEGDGELGGFWLRKSRQPVLAVLLVEKVDAATGRKAVVAHRGVNCEVSMPTGSLCAERNAIGSALASDPTLRRHALKMIGVLSLNLAETNAVVASTTKTTTATATATVITNNGHSDATAVTVAATTVQEETAVVAAAVDQVAEPSSTEPVDALVETLAETKRKRSGEDATPRRPKRPRTFSVDDTSVEALLLPADRNPLAPCGACKEWLVKIAEANPAFRVVTFEDARCRSVYAHQLL